MWNVVNIKQLDTMVIYTQVALRYEGGLKCYCIWLKTKLCLPRKATHYNMQMTSLTYGVHKPYQKG